MPLQEGARLQVLIESGAWLDGTYTWSGVAARWPGLRIELGGPIPQDVVRRPAAVMALPPQATVRRPLAASAREVSPASAAMPSEEAAERR
jgi:hypothetical protein